MRASKLLCLGIAVTLGGFGCGGGGGSTDDPTGGWTVTTVNANTGVRSIAIALDPSGQPRVAWLDQATGKVSYASRSGSVWTTVDVPGVTTGDEGMVLAIDASGRPHLAFQVDNHTAAGGVRYATHDGTAWSVETVESTVVGARSPSLSLALTGAGVPVIAYYAGDGAGQGLKVATRTGANAFSIVSPDTTQWAGFGGTSIAIDASGNPMVSYTIYGYTPYGGSSGLKLASYDGSAWTVETADPTYGAGGGSSLVLDGTGRPHIAYRHFDGANVDEIRYAVKGATWTQETVGLGSVGPALALASDGTPWVAFGVAPSSRIKVGSRAGTSWSLEQVPATLADWGLDLAVSATGVPHLVYDDGSTSDAMYATRN